MEERIINMSPDIKVIELIMDPNTTTECIKIKKLVVDTKILDEYIVFSTIQKLFPMENDKLPTIEILEYIVNEEDSDDEKEIIKREDDYKSIQKILSFKLKEDHLPDKIFTESCKKDMKKFLDTIVILVNLIKANVSLDQSKYFVDYLKKEISKNKDTDITVKSTYESDYNNVINEFISSDLLKLKINDNFLMNYIVTYYKMIEDMSIIVYTKENRPYIDSESYMKTISEFPQIDYNILILNSITSNYIGMYSKTRESFDEIVATIYRLYKLSLIIYKKYIVNNSLEAFFDNIIIPRIIYDSKMDGQFVAIRTVFSASIDKNETINNQKYRDEVTATSSQILNKTVGRMKKCGIDDVSDLSANSIGKIGSSIENITESLKDDIKTKKIKKSALTEVGYSLIEMFKEMPNAKKDMPEFVGMVNCAIELMDTAKKQGHKMGKSETRIYDTLKRNFYDPDIKLPPEAKKMIQKQKKGMKLQQKFKMSKQ